ncbi:DUF4350 domain-containing protein [Pseudomonas abieticivorans]|uniref:DUF4350 domain-containing protein n=1 Tax=Pseudomonas abieticivorans TaxID=2931382 RepID=UPI0020BEC8D5|nr:DUF4350 domain-containing protein [Pseudomonas sp. PIA16]
MTRRERGLLGLLIALALVLLGLALARHLHRYTETIDHGQAPEARANPYLAAQQYLRQRGLVATLAPNYEALAQLPSNHRSLLLLGDRSYMTPNQAGQLLSWVRRGGRLLFVAEALWDEHKGMSGDLLLDRLQLHQLLSRDLPQLPKAADDDFPRLTKLYLENEKAPAYFGFDPAFHLEDPTNKAQSWANSANATHLMQLTLGDGLITVVTDADLWTNGAIGRYDNAWLLWYLNQGTDVTLLFNSDHDSLWTLLQRYYPQALLALALLVAMALWRLGLREGPIRQPEPLARRQLQEHLQASASFLLRHAGQDALLRSLQQDVLRRARRRHPGFEKLPVAEQWLVLARLTRQPTSAIGHALRPRPRQRLSAADFSRQVAHLQTLRNAL